MILTLICAAPLVDGLVEVLDGGLIGEPEVAFGIADTVQHGPGLVSAGTGTELCSVFFGYIKPPGQVQFVLFWARICVLELKFTQLIKLKSHINNSKKCIIG